MFDWITSLVARLGYLGVVVLTFLENLFPPIPSEVVIPLAGFVAARGSLQLTGVIVAGTIGSLAGALLWYFVARRIGERRFRDWVDRHGRWLTLSGEDVDRAQQWFARHGASAVIVGRLIPGVRTFISLPAGFSRMPVGRFIAYSALGTMIWTGLLAWAGVALEANFTIVSDYIDLIADTMLGVVGLLLAKRYYQCWKGRAWGEEPS